MDLDLAPIKAAFAELSKPELHALINAAKAAPQIAPLTLHVERLLFDHRYDRFGSICDRR